MWARELFASFIGDSFNKDGVLAKNISPATKKMLRSIKSVYKKRRKQGMTPFIVSILHNDEALCEQLIEEGIDFNQQDPVGVQLSYLTFSQFNIAADELKTLGPNSSVFKDFNKTTPMFWAIKCDKLRLINKLIQCGHKMNGLVEKFAGMPALSYAVASENVPVVDHFLLNKLCDIHEKSFPNTKPLDLAIRSSNQDMVRTIMKHGENPNCANHFMSPLLSAVFMKNFSMVKLLLKMGANLNTGLFGGKSCPPLIMAVKFGQFKIASLLISRGANVKNKDYKDDTALHVLMQMIKNNSDIQPVLKMARLLLKNCALVDVPNENGDVPLVAAICLCEPMLVDLFLSNPIDLNTQLFLTEKLTILQIAVVPPDWFSDSGLKDRNPKDYSQRRYHIAKSLIEKGADVNKQSGYGNISLHYAADAGDVKLVELLLAASNVDVNKLSDNGWTALHFAVYNGSFEVVRLILESGAEVNVTANNGLTPLDFAIVINEYLSCDTVSLLIEYGADIFSNCVHMNKEKYDNVVVTLRADLIKLLWREGYPYDSTVLPPSNESHQFVQDFLSTLSQDENVIANYVTTNRKQVEELMDAQDMFMNGVTKNKAKLVLKALDKGAEVNGVSNRHKSTLHFLAKKGFTDVAQVLLSKGVKPNTVDDEGNIPVDLAVQFGHYRMYVTLLQYGGCYDRTGFDTSIFQKEGNNQLYELYLLIKDAFKSVKRGDHYILNSLNKYVTLKEWDVYHALVNCVDGKGRTLMGLAVDRGYTDIIKKLMEYRLQAPETSLSQVN